MTETAVVRSIEGNIIKMGCEPAEGCSTCSSSFCSAEKRVFEAINHKGLDIVEGDIVDVYLAPGKTVLAGFLVLIVPLLLFAAGYLLAGKLSSEASEGFRAVIGIAGLAAGFLLSFSYSRKQKAQNMPTIVAVRKKGGNPANDGSSPVN